MSFQTQVNAVQAPGVAGAFADTNPRHSYMAGPGGLICGPLGVACGYFGWVDDATGQVVTNYGSGAPDGFVHNAHQALITEYLGQATLVVPAGFMMGDLFSGGGFWIQNNTGQPVIPGLKVYANNSTGAASSFAATGTPARYDFAEIADGGEEGPWTAKEVPAEIEGRCYAWLALHQWGLVTDG